MFSWERALEKEQKRALSEFQTDFWTVCKKYSPSVDKVLMSLKNEAIDFRPYTLPSKRTNDSQDDVAPQKRQRRIDQPGRCDPIANIQIPESMVNRLDSERNGRDTMQTPDTCLSGSPLGYTYAAIVLEHLDSSDLDAFGIEKNT